MGWRDIEHVVVLMQENNSFDRILGWMSEAEHGVDGAPSGVSCPAGPPLFPEGTMLPVEPGANLIAPGAPHQFYDMSRQLHPQDGPPNSGFGHVAAQFASHRHLDDAAKMELARENLRYHRRDDLPVTRDLALSFAVADRWFCPIASSTWPNRYFAHFGTSPSDGLPLPQLAPELPSIYARLNDAGLGWRLYVDGLACAAACEGILHQARRAVRAGQDRPIRPFDRFVCDVSVASPPSQDLATLARFERHGVDFTPRALPAYTFIEPRHVTHNGQAADNDHHGNHKHRGQRLIASVYNALRAEEEVWRKTLLIVTYDENGGYYDHVPPPAAPHPITGQLGKTPREGALDWYGARVPALLISPWIRRGAYKTVCDHTSILAFLERRFDLRPLTQRDARADDLPDAFGDVYQPGPAWLEPPPVPTGDGEAADVPTLELAMVKDLARRAGADGEAEVAALPRETLIGRAEARQDVLFETLENPTR